MNLLFPRGDGLAELGPLVGGVLELGVQVDYLVVGGIEINPGEDQVLLQVIHLHLECRLLLGGGLGSGRDGRAQLCGCLLCLGQLHLEGDLLRRGGVDG